MNENVSDKSYFSLLNLSFPRGFTMLTFDWPNDTFIVYLRVSVTVQTRIQDDPGSS